MLPMARSIGSGETYRLLSINDQKTNCDELTLATTRGRWPRVSQTRLADRLGGFCRIDENKEIVIFFAEDSHGLIPGVKKSSINEAVRWRISYG